MEGGRGQSLISSKLLSSSVHLRGKPLNHFFPPFLPIYASGVDRRHMHFSIRSVSHLLSYTHQGSAQGKYSPTWLGTESGQVKPLLSTRGHWSAPVEQLEVAQGHLNSSCSGKTEHRWLASLHHAQRLRCCLKMWHVRVLFPAKSRLSLLNWRLLWWTGCGFIVMQPLLRCVSRGAHVYITRSVKGSN